MRSPPSPSLRRTCLSRSRKLSSRGRAREQQRAHLAAPSAPPASPSPAATIDPFIRMCHCRANAVRILAPASATSRSGCADLAQVLDARAAPGIPRSGSLSITLMKVQPSKSAARTTRRTSRRSPAGDRPPSRARRSPRPPPSRGSSVPRAPAGRQRPSSSLEPSCGTASSSPRRPPRSTVSTPTARVPCRLNSSYAVSRIRSRPSIGLRSMSLRPFEPGVAGLVAARVVGVEIDEAALDQVVAHLEHVAPATPECVYASAPGAVVVLPVRTSPRRTKVSLPVMIQLKFA